MAVHSESATRRETDAGSSAARRKTPVYARLASLTDTARGRGFEQQEEGGNTFWLIVECRAPVAMSALHASLDVIDGHGASVFNLYAPYLRG
jgi:hypothetical protein